ncbi:MAG: hypothetical protein LBI61_01225 [Puniceicoccales bacterium]|jgi:hypothetical protein|nr:hypothetical protein [Puniceicoccales bacterium]
MAKGALRGPKPKIQGTAKVVKPSSVAAREVELAGTGIKLKIPVEEPLAQAEASLRQERVPGQREIGNTGSYKELRDGTGPGGFKDGKDAHHIPSKAFMEKHGVKKDDGLAVILTKEQHNKTRTMRKLPTNNTPRDEFARDIVDVREILKGDNEYTPDVNSGLLEDVKRYESRYPDIFKKEPKK